MGKIKEALAALADIGQLRLSGLDETLEGSLGHARSALEAADAMQQDFESIEAYGRAHPVTNPNIFFSDGKWYGHITDEIKSMREGGSYAEVHSELAAWCRAELAK